MKFLRIYLGEGDHCDGTPVYKHIVKLCYDHGIKGVTVLKGIMGFGEKHHVHRVDFFTLSEDLPIVVEIVDSSDKIEKIIEEVKKCNFDGLVVYWDVESIRIEKNK
ncbi:hypothetical protein XO10_05000 [Marinitoga sp. 1135]|uniref:Uncharacterized protein n=1 Tax=Marinitoga piezophila (strain DSM 14283 / JCM 11233 / KA3) TaxID=443254 RepID=H2J7L3_MARPK|nr:MULTISPECIES: DUF190 domain-containing protein [Marinitoga]AEX85354.1 hypothetical protein Marpi_0941 [Marinitoga piezophila KA3]APT75832.1 hypothetical protein LN42_05160 [Marinitoga sp. 1137]NUU95632.1 hypothetical protein [Marinitoga sp. 1135]NUU97489.1 hypothetical protein [Marinitoga sp. 1138]